MATGFGTAVFTTAAVLDVGNSESDVTWRKTFSRNGM